MNRLPYTQPLQAPELGVLDRYSVRNVLQSDLVTRFATYIGSPVEGILLQFVAELIRADLSPVFAKILLIYQHSKRGRSPKCGGLAFSNENTAITASPYLNRQGGVTTCLGLIGIARL